MRSQVEIESDRELAVARIQRAQADARVSGCPRAAVDRLTAEILWAIRDAVVCESLLEPAVTDVRAIAALVGITLTPVEGEEEENNDENQ